MRLLIDGLTAVLMLIGASLTLLAAIGLVRLPDTFLRMQATAKASTLGVACLLAGAALQLPDVSSIMKLGSIAAFIMLTAPLSAHVVARAALHRARPLWEGTVLNEYEASECAPPVEQDGLRELEGDADGRATSSAQDPPGESRPAPDDSV
jgi:multicomponent Na+:H+ antiporter subunit G